mgnify:FL=1|jgi:hypothetical protein
MTSAIGSSTSMPIIRPAPVSAQQVKTVAMDSDGDHDGSKAGEVEMPKATSGSVGTRINTTA